MKMKVMTRLQNITYLQTLLERALSGNAVNTRLWQSPSYTSGFFLNTVCVPGTPGFVPPVANFDGDGADVSSLSSAAPVNKAKKGDLTCLAP